MHQVFQKKIGLNGQNLQIFSNFCLFLNQKIILKFEKLHEIMIYKIWNGTRNNFTDWEWGPIKARSLAIINP